MATQTKWTPGPWSPQSHVGDYHARAKTFVVSQAIERSNCDKDVIVAEIEWHRFGSADRRPTNPQEQQANAALIAAAPDLYAQLEALATQLEVAGMIVPPNVNAALNKAEGRS
jgi:hypothetical protein